MFLALFLKWLRKDFNLWCSTTILSIDLHYLRVTLYTALIYDSAYVVHTTCRHILSTFILIRKKLYYLKLRRRSCNIV